MLMGTSEGRCDTIIQYSLSSVLPQIVPRRNNYRRNDDDRNVILVPKLISVLVLCIVVVC